LLLEVSAPLYTRPQFTRQEVADLTANPDATEAIIEFLKNSGIPHESIDSGNYGEYIKVSAPIHKWNSFLQTEFHIYELDV